MQATQRPMRAHGDTGLDFAGNDVEAKPMHPESLNQRVHKLLDKLGPDLSVRI